MMGKETWLVMEYLRKEICKGRIPHGRGVWEQVNGARRGLTRQVQKCHIKTNSKLMKIESIEFNIVNQKENGKGKA